MQFTGRFNTKKHLLRLKGFAKNDFLQKSFILVSGTAVAQAIPIATAPIITRLYTPENYGVLGLFMVVSSILSLLATMQFQFAIVKEKEEEEAFKVLELCLCLSLIISLLSFIPVILFGHAISSYLNTPQLEFWLLFVPFSVLIVGWNNSLSAWANRHSWYRLMSMNRIAAAVITPITSISFAFIFSDAKGLFIGLFIGQLVSFIVLGYYFLKQEPKKFAFQKIYLRASWRKHFNFPKYNLPSEFLNLLVAQFPMFILGRYYGLAAVGQFNLSNRMLNMPSMLVSQAIGEVFRQRASKEYNDAGRCDKFLIKTFLGLFSIAIVPFAFIFVFGSEIFKIFFGEAWFEAGVYSQILSPMYFLRFVISPLTFVCFLAGKHHVSLVGSLVYAITTIILSYVISVYSDNVYDLLTAYVINFACIYMVMFYLNYTYSKGVNEIQRKHSGIF